jgi:hypothetical protein
MGYIVSNRRPSVDEECVKKNCFTRLHLHLSKRSKESITDLSGQLAFNLEI